MLPFIDQKPKCGSGTWIVHLLLSVCGVRVPRLGLGVRVKRTVRFQEVVEIIGCGAGQRINHPGSNSLVGAPGRNISILAEQARASRDHAPGFLWQWKPWKSQTTYSVSGQVWPGARVREAFRPNRLHLSGRKQPGIRQESGRN